MAKKFKELNENKTFQQIIDYNGKSYTVDGYLKQLDKELDEVFSVGERNSSRNARLLSKSN